MAVVYANVFSTVQYVCRPRHASLCTRAAPRRAAQLRKSQSVRGEDRGVRPEEGVRHATRRDTGSAQHSTEDQSEQSPAAASRSYLFVLRAICILMSIGGSAHGGAARRGALLYRFPSLRTGSWQTDTPTATATATA